MDEDVLIGVSEAAELLGVSKQTLANWRSRRADFPPPIAELKSGPIWSRASVVAWAQEQDIPIADETALDPGPAPDEPKATVALMNMKGGVGKSTLTCNLGWFCGYKRNQRVLLVDLDPQFNLSQYAMGTTRYRDHIDSGKGTVLDVFEQITPRSVTKKKPKSLDPTDVITRVAGWRDGSFIDLVPSSLDLAWTLKNSSGKETLLASFLDSVRSSYDMVFIDCAPTESMLTTAAYHAADSVLIPVKPEYLATIGLPLLVQSLNDYERVHHRTVDVLGIAFNDGMNKSEHNRARADVKKVAGSEGWYVFKNEVSHSDSYPRGSRFGKPIFLTDYARDYVVGDFLAFADEFMKRLKA